MATTLLVPDDDDAAAGRLRALAPGADLPALAARTRLPLTELVALDRGDVSRCGGDFYLRAHLTCIATALDLDPGALLAAFGRRPAPHPEPGAPLLVAPVRPRRHRTVVRAATALALTALVAVAVAGFTGWRRAGDGGSPPAGGQQPAAAAASPAGPAASRSPGTPPPTASATHPGTAPTPPAVPGGVTVGVAVAGGPSWLSARDGSGQLLFEGTLPAGGTQVLRGSSVSAVFGNAGAVTLACNGHQLGVPGAPGQVVSATFLPGSAGC